MRDFNHAVAEYAKGDLQYCESELKIIKRIIAIFLEWEDSEDEDYIIYLKSQLAECEIKLLGARELIHGFDVKAEDFPIVVDDTILYTRGDLSWAYENWEDEPILIKKLNDALMDAHKMRQIL